MKNLSKILELILKNEDIEGLIATGAPSDEYNLEAKYIAEGISKLKKDQINQETIVAIIAMVWANQFGQSPEEILLRVPSFIRVAENLMVNGNLNKS
jgi:hypothetical protein